MAAVGTRRRLRIRQALASDLPALTASFDQEFFFQERFARQQRDEGRLLVAKLGRRAVGDVYLWLGPAEEEDLRTRLPRVPLLTHLEVLPEYRNQGIGSDLIAECERLLRERGVDRVALGVGLDNAAATRLYHRLGYVEWDHGILATEKVTFLEGLQEIREWEKCRVMIKSL